MSGTKAPDGAAQTHAEIRKFDADPPEAETLDWDLVRALLADRDNLAEHHAWVRAQRDYLLGGLSWSEVTANDPDAPERPS